MGTKHSTLRQNSQNPEKRPDVENSKSNIPKISLEEVYESLEEYKEAINNVYSLSRLLDDYVDDIRDKMNDGDENPINSVLLTTLHDGYTKETAKSYCEVIELGVNIELVRRARMLFSCKQYELLDGHSIRDIRNSKSTETLDGEIIANKGNLLDSDLIALCEKINSALPEVPLKKDNEGNTALAPAEQYNPKIRNFENPELYAIFPYRLFGVGRDNLEVARTAYENRKFKQADGWQQDAIQAALIGETEEARRMVVDGFNTKHEGSRFPAFWGPNADWIPDQDHGSVNVRALQNMLIQEVGDTILLMPAFPAEWSVDFKIHASGNTVIEARLKDGVIEYLKVTPESRKKDIVNMLLQ